MIDVARMAAYWRIAIPDYTCLLRPRVAVGASAKCNGPRILHPWPTARTHAKALSSNSKECPQLTKMEVGSVPKLEVGSVPKLRMTAETPNGQVPELPQMHHLVLDVLPSQKAMERLVRVRIGSLQLSARRKSYALKVS